MDEPLIYLSKSEKLDGTLKSTPESFIVEEISSDGKIIEINKPFTQADSPATQKYLHIALQKRNYSTDRALKMLAERLHIGKKRFSFTGTKDKVALTTQLISCFGCTKEQLANISITDIKLLGSYYSNKPLSLGDHLGNRFTITVDGGVKTKVNENGTKVEKIWQELGGKSINYFGPQRFGSRKNTHKIGYFILKGMFEDAVFEYLCGGEEDESAGLRRELLQTRDYVKALNAFPVHLRYERAMLDYLADKQRDFIGALRRLPRKLGMMLVHAYQSHLFNQYVSMRLRDNDFDPKENEFICGNNNYGFPDLEKKSNDNTGGWLACNVIGYDSKLNETEKKLLAEAGISNPDFKIKKIPEFSSSGSLRTMFMPIKDFAYDEKENTFRFSLPKSGYATVVLEEFVKNRRIG